MALFLHRERILMQSECICPAISRDHCHLLQNYGIILASLAEPHLDLQPCISLSGKSREIIIPIKSYP